jgi:tetratricopeptide (TPR) repeat protein
MSKLHLAVSVGSFLAFAFPAFSQSSLPLTTAHLTAPQVVGSRDDAKKLSDEERGRLYLVRKEYPEAQQIFHRLTTEFPRNAVYWNELGISFHSQADLNDALKCYEKSAKLDKHYPDPQNNIGTIYYARKKYAKAVRAYKRALNIRDDYAAFYLNLGYAYFAEKLYDDSIASFRKALEFDPDAFDAHARSGTVIQDRSIGTDRAHFYYLLAKSFAESGNVERCAIYLKKARDEGYQDLNAANSDPSFAKVLKAPAVQEALNGKIDAEAQP